MRTTSGPPRLPRAWWIGVLCAFVVLIAAMAAYVAVTPVGEQKDELAHLNYAELISRHLALPTAKVQERQQPPLYYAMVAVALRSTGDNLRAARWVSVTLVVITAVLLLWTLRLVVPARPWVALAGLWLFALLPSVQSEGAQVSNDTLAWLAGAATLLVTVLVLERRLLTLRLSFAVGAVLGVVALSKATVWPLALLMLLAIGLRHRRELRLTHIAAVAVPAAAIAGWWFLRNLTTFHRPLPPLTPIGSIGVHTIRSLGQLASWVSLSWKSTVGIEGPQQTPLVIGPGRLGLYLLAIFGICLAAVVAFQTLRAAPSWWLRWDRPAIYMLAAAVLVVGFSLLNSVTLDDQPQARYLLVAAPVWCGGVAWAIAGLFRNRPGLLRVLVPVALVGMIALDAGSVQTMRLAV